MFLISAGRLFHSLGAANGKARSVSVGRHRVLACTNKGASPLRHLSIEASNSVFDWQPRRTCMRQACAAG